MENKEHKISRATRKRLEQQGYINFSDQELYDFKFGFRFAYILCSTLVAVGLILTSIPILIIALVFAFFGMFPPYHPFDYLYNYGVRKVLKKPKTPPRANQGRFACMMATLWLAAVIYLFYKEMFLEGYILGGLLVGTAFLVSYLDLCIPSMIYNLIFKKNK
jgi:hypothetical protein